MVLIRGENDSISTNMCLGYFGQHGILGAFGDWLPFTSGSLLVKIENSGWHCSEVLWIRSLKGESMRALDLRWRSIRSKIPGKGVGFYVLTPGFTSEAGMSWYRRAWRRRGRIRWHIDVWQWSHVLLEASGVSKRFGEARRTSSRCGKRQPNATHPEQTSSKINKFNLCIKYESGPLEL